MTGKIAFIGGGKMAAALIGGIIANGFGVKAVVRLIR